MLINILKRYDFHFSNENLYILNETNDYYDDYEELLDTIHKNIYFFIDNYKIITKLLLSKTFREKFYYTKHPYPSLLDPNETDYEQIPSNLAWNINLPLIKNYNFLWFFCSSSDPEAMFNFFKHCDINLMGGGESAEENYAKTYEYLKYENYSIITIPCITKDNFNKSNYLKFLYLIDKKVPIIYVARDPISILKSGINHIDENKTLQNIKTHMKNFNFNQKYENLFPNIEYIFSKDGKPYIPFLENLLNKHNINFYFTENKRLKILEKICKNIEYIDFSDYKFRKCF
ncbi:hypothetical protein IY971_05050 [Campylobacter volucris]|uniref:hypothetical protein n=1 Tax=Campylobacter volucris TaxID=1031542 RepID=UPI00189F571D|nr:hypothetical protein [Campylobacter volucris]MBF7042767.1 hypothetical protein [Campylobacter volucris]